MVSIRNISRVIAAAVVSSVVALSAAPANAEPFVPIEWNVDATSHLAKLDKDLHVPTGTFKGTYDMGTGQITGDLDLPEATSQLDIGSLPLANVVMKMEQAAPVTGTLNIFTMESQTTSTFNVRIKSIRPVFLPFINLVNSGCITQKPVVSQLSGIVDLAAGSTFTGSYELPKFKNCGFGVNSIINLIVPGPGNTMTAQFTPIAH